jgi:hypothetical protein
MTEPRGIRCNNPLNIEYSAKTQWRGLDDPPSDGRFARFTEPQWGVRAAIMVLRSYHKRGIRSVRQIVSTWAPAHENNTESYIGAVVRRTNFRPDTVIDITNKDQVIALLKAMELVENGHPRGTANGQWLDDLVYESAWSLANPLDRSRTMIGGATAGAATAAQGLLDVVQESTQQAAVVADTVGMAWPEIARWVLLAVAMAGIGYALYARWQARQDGVR